MSCDPQCPCCDNPIFTYGLVPHADLCCVFPINQSVFADFWALIQMDKMPDTFFKLQLSCLCTGHVSMKEVNSLRAHQLFGVL